MSSEPIELTREERHAAREAFRNATTDDYGYGSGTAVDDIIAAVNGVRVGDPVGTIRKGYRTGEVAVRIDVPGHSPWRVNFAGGDTGYVFADCVQSWPVIYRADGAA